MVVGARITATGGCKIQPEREPQPTTGPLGPLLLLELLESPPGGSGIKGPVELLESVTTSLLLLLEETTPVDEDEEAAGEEEEEDGTGADDED